MSTRCWIALANERNSGYRRIYCHNDGHPNRVGKILAEHYTDRDKVEKLISLGGISSLGEKIEPTDPKHSFETPEKGVTVFYTRDRGENWAINAPGKNFDLPDLVSAVIGQGDIEYLYVFERGKWQCLYVDNVVIRAAQNDFFNL